MTATDAAPSTVTMIESGSFTTVQDLTGRAVYWHVGVPPNGPMDDLSHRLTNRVGGNHPSAACLQLTNAGPTLRFASPAALCESSGI